MMSKLINSRGWTVQCSCSAMWGIWNTATQAQVGDDLANALTSVLTKKLWGTRASFHYCGWLCGYEQRAARQQHLTSSEHWCAPPRASSSQQNGRTDFYFTVSTSHQPCSHWSQATSMPAPCVYITVVILYLAEVWSCCLHQQINWK